MFTRWRVFTHKKIQTRLALTYLFWSFIFVFVLVAIYFLNFADAVSNSSNIYIHDRLALEVMLVEQAKKLALWYGIAVILFVILSFFFVVVYSHRLTGPIYKLEQVLDKCIHNKNLPDKDLSFRKTDAFHELAAKFNQFIDVLKNQKPS